MKTVSADLAKYLEERNEYRYCDLYKLTFLDGTIWYMTSYDDDVTYNGHRYDSKVCLITRDQTSITGAPTVDTLRVTLTLTVADALGGVPLIKMAHDGGFDNCYLLLTRLFMDVETETILGAVNLFTGRCEVSSCTSIECEITVKSDAVGLSARVPLRVFAPQNVYYETDGQVATSSNDVYTCMIPLKPTKNVLVPST